MEHHLADFDRHPERAAQIDVDDEVEFFFGVSLGRFAFVDSGNVQQHVDAAELVGDFLNALFDVALLRGVADDRHDRIGRRANLSGGRFERARVAAGDDDFGSARGETGSQRFADSAATSGNKRDFVGNGKQWVGGHVVFLEIISRNALASG
ncbi:MAG: hypothetical protein FD138_2857 [Planctomycetota bacterium]|nr:MAG: hypothetical protein FD138_2857 [Planctomycetota bacterium]